MKRMNVDGSDDIDGGNNEEDKRRRRKRWREKSRERRKERIIWKERDKEKEWKIENARKRGKFQILKYLYNRESLARWRWIPH